MKFLQEAWYCAALSEEVTLKPIRRVASSIAQSFSLEAAQGRWSPLVICGRTGFAPLTPGLIDTPLMERLDISPEAMAALAAGIVPMGRAGTPTEAATAALFLASDDSSFMTGGEIIVSGGQLNL